MLWLYTPGWVDGGISVCEPMRSVLRTARDDRRYAFQFTQRELWEGNEACEGVIRDWASWKREGGDAFERLTRVLTALSPSSATPLRAGELRRISVSDKLHYPTLAMPYGEEVPIIHASAGMRRIISLAYALVWLWQEHLDVCHLLGREPHREVVFLIDEVEAHLHPQWQRRIVPALLDVMEALTGEDGVSVQLVTVTHSPLVLASVEPEFDTARDAIWTLDLDAERKVTLEEFPFSRRGGADDWLTSEIFDLDETGSVAAEQALKAARHLLLEDAPAPEDIERADAALKATLGGTDRFWLRWSAWRDAQLDRAEGHP